MRFQISARKGAILRAKRAGLVKRAVPVGVHARTCPAVDIHKAARQGQHRYGADAD